MATSAFDLYAEVIDANAGVVLASEGPIKIERAQTEMIGGWFGIGWSGYRRIPGADGQPLVKMSEMRLVGR
jgi:hypothetical protein